MYDFILEKLRYKEGMKWWRLHTKLKPKSSQNLFSWPLMNKVDLCYHLGGWCWPSPWSGEEAWCIHNTILTWNDNVIVHVPVCYITPHPDIISFYHSEFTRWGSRSLRGNSHKPKAKQLMSSSSRAWTTHFPAYLGPFLGAPAQYLSGHTSPSPDCMLLLGGHRAEDLGFSFGPSFMLAVQFWSCHSEPSFILPSSE